VFLSAQLRPGADADWSLVLPTGDGINPLSNKMAG
jgi:hypothetical protein